MLLELIRTIDDKADREAAERALARIDALLPRVGQTRFRGIVEMSRAGMLGRAARYREASAAAQEAARLLPGYPEPLMMAAHAEHYADRPDAAVDLLLRAHALDRHILSEMSQYDVDGLRERLSAINETERVAALAAALFEAGWEGASDTVSHFAFALMTAKLKAGDLPAATAQVNRIIVPSLYQEILSNEDYAPVRPAALQFAGGRLEKLWPLYLGRMRAEWEGRRYPRALAAYERALLSAKHYHSVAATFLPLYDRPLDAQDEGVLIASVRLATALAHLGRWEDAHRVFARVVAAFANFESANRLNGSINQAVLLLGEGRAAEALRAFDAVLADAAKWPTEVGEANFVRIHGRRVCALQELGRLTEQDSSWLFVWSRRERFPVEAVTALLCRDDIKGAKKLALRMLEDERTRPEAIALVQPFSSEPLPSEYDRRRRASQHRLAVDPELRAAAGRYATLLDRPLNDAAPPDPLAPRAP